MVKRFFLAVILTAVSVISIAQEVKEVTLVVNGDGATKEEATHAALRSAIEQAFGTFVSANTTILNDELVKDEIATVSSGNIQSFTELSSYTLPNGNTSVSLQVTVSIGKLVTYAKSKGSECEFAGAIFGANIKMLKLKYENSKKAFANLVQYIKEVGPSVFDKRISASDPKASSGSYKVMLTVSFDTNANTFVFYDHVMSTMRAIGLTRTDIEHLVAILGPDLEKELYQIELGYYPAYNKRGLMFYLNKYCLGSVVSTNLGIIDTVYGSSYEVLHYSSVIVNEDMLWRDMHDDIYNDDILFREDVSVSDIYVLALYKRMFDYFLMHDDASNYKAEYLRRFYSWGNMVEYYNDNNIYLWKKYEEGLNLGVLMKPGKFVYVDWYYQVPFPPLYYEHYLSADELSKITGFFVK